jgi:hypothetical protein
MSPNTTFALPLSSVTTGGLVPSSSANYDTQVDSVFGRRKSWIDRMVDVETLQQQIPEGQGAQLQVKFVNSAVELLDNQMKKDDGPKKKRTRTSPEQLKVLQSAFDADPLPNAVTRMNLAKQLGMNVRAVQIWFQNRRAKGKLDQKRNEHVSKAQKGVYMMHSVDQKRVMEDCANTYDNRPVMRSLSVSIAPDNARQLFEHSNIPRHLMIPSYYDIPPLTYTSPTEDTIPMMRDSGLVSSELLDSPDNTGGSISSADSPPFHSFQASFGSHFEKGLGIDLNYPDTFRRCYSMPNVYHNLPSSQIAQLHSKSLTNVHEEQFKIDEADDEALSNYIDVPDDTNPE